MAKKAVIQVVTGKKKDNKIEVMYNPNEYSIETSNQFSSSTITGLSEPITQFISGNAPTLTMELFFDSYEKKEDVRKYTEQVVSLLYIDSELHAPPIVKFIWNPMQGTSGFKGVLEKATQKFTMFSSSGMPVRATLNVTFRSVKGITEQLQEIPRHSADRTKQKTLKQGEHLWMIAEEEYQNPGQWREIARANNIDNPRVLKHGVSITVPRLE